MFKNKPKTIKYNAIYLNRLSYKGRYGEREVQTAKQKAQAILDVLPSIFATQIVLRSRSSGA